MTGKATPTIAVPPPSATGDDYVAAGPSLLWVFRGSRLSQLNPATGTIIASARDDPIAPARPGSYDSGYRMRLGADRCPGVACQLMVGLMLVRHQGRNCMAMM